VVSKGRQQRRVDAKRAHLRRSGPVIFVEGGARGELFAAARRAVRRLLEQLSLREHPTVIACGGRTAAFEKFCEHLQSGKPERAFLLVDAEEVVSSAPWRHVRTRPADGWEKPAPASDDALFFMSVVMETWCLADGASIQRALGLSADYAPPASLERLPKADVYSALEALTDGKWNTHTKASSFQFLEQVRASELKKHCPEFKRLAERLRQVSSS
jgi:hypothetical protein